MTRTLALVLLVACSKPAASPPPATPTPPAPPAAEQPTKPDATIEHDPDAPPKRDAAPPEPHQAELAARADADGTVLFDAKKYGDASAKFRDAFARAPTAKYASDLCRSLYHEGKFGEALTACDAGSHLDPDAALAASITKQTDQIKADAKAQRIQLRSK